MCLRQVDEVISSKPRYGYKLMYRTRLGNYKGEYNQAPAVRSYKIGIWYKGSIGRTILSDYSGNYPEGFHIYESLEAVYNKIYERSALKIVKVQIKDIVVTGMQSRWPAPDIVIVAKQIKIIGEIDPQTKKLKKEI